MTNPYEGPAPSPTCYLSLNLIWRQRLCAKICNKTRVPTHKPTSPWTDSSFVDFFSSLELWDSTLQRRMRQPVCPSSGSKPGGTPVRRPRE